MYQLFVALVRCRAAYAILSASMKGCPLKSTSSHPIHAIGSVKPSYFGVDIVVWSRCCSCVVVTLSVVGRADCYCGYGAVSVGVADGIGGCRGGDGVTAVWHAMPVNRLLHTPYMMSVVVEECGSPSLDSGKAWSADAMAFFVFASCCLIIVAHSIVVIAIFVAASSVACACSTAARRLLIMVRTLLYSSNCLVMVVQKLLINWRSSETSELLPVDPIWLSTAGDRSCLRI